MNLYDFNPPYKDVGRVPLWTLVSVESHPELLGSRAYHTKILDLYDRTDKKMDC